MAITRYESPKPAYQNVNRRNQPPMGSKAVFEWEKFQSLGGDYSDSRMTEVFKRISRDIIERPYHYQNYPIANKHGKLISTKFKPANNSEPPPKIDGGVLYKRNHGSVHALRQMVYTDALLDIIAEKGNSTGKDIAQKINANDEIKSAIKLAAFCKRIGRTFDSESDKTPQKGGFRPAHKPTIYSERSAQMFARIADELGYPADLIKIIQDSMLEPVPKDAATLNSYPTIDGIRGKDLRRMSEQVLMVAHRIDLTRIDTVRKHAIESNMSAYFDKSQLPEIANHMIVMGCKANAMTGNKVARQQDGIDYKTVIKNVDGQRAVEAAADLGKTRAELAILHPNGAAHVQKKNPHVTKHHDYKAAEHPTETVVPVHDKKNPHATKHPDHKAAEHPFNTVAPVHEKKNQHVTKHHEHKAEKLPTDTVVPAQNKKNPHVKNYYDHKAFGTTAGRFHFFAASVDDSLPAELKRKYKGRTGDNLKTYILRDLQKEIDGFTDRQSLEHFKETVRERPEYKILKTAQNLYGRMTGKTTSSIEALEDMIAQKENTLPSPSSRL